MRTPTFPRAVAMVALALVAELALGFVILPPALAAAVVLALVAAVAALALL